MNKVTDKDYLRRALELSKQSREPIKCACIIVKDGQVLAETINSQHVDNVAVHHAEVKAVRAANEKIGSRKLERATAYCSCEPCVMCLSALSLARIERIVFNETMNDVAPDDPMGQLDSAAFAAQYLNFVPKLEQLLI